MAELDDPAVSITYWYKSINCIELVYPLNHKHVGSYYLSLLQRLKKSSNNDKEITKISKIVDRITMVHQ